MVVRGSNDAKKESRLLGLDFIFTHSTIVLVLLTVSVAVTILYIMDT